MAEPSVPVLTFQLTALDYLFLPPVSVPLRPCGVCARAHA